MGRGSSARRLGSGGNDPDYAASGLRRENRAKSPTAARTATATVTSLRHGDGISRRGSSQRRGRVRVVISEFSPVRLSSLRSSGAEPGRLQAGRALPAKACPCGRRVAFGPRDEPLGRTPWIVLYAHDVGTRPAASARRSELAGVSVRGPDLGQVSQRRRFGETGRRSCPSDLGLANRLVARGLDTTTRLRAARARRRWPRSESSPPAPRRRSG